MMYGQGKSDSPIVPMKSPNNAAPAAAEAMEGRGGAKGNAVRGSTCQTQSWESVSPGTTRPDASSPAKLHTVLPRSIPRV